MEFEVSDYNHKTDAAELIEIFFDAYENFGREGIKNYVNRMAVNEELYAKRSFKKDGKLVAFCTAGRISNEDNSQIQTLIGNDRKFKKNAILDIMKILKEKRVENVIVYLNPDNPVEAEEAEDFTAIGFEKRNHMIFSRRSCNNLGYNNYFNGGY